MSYLVLARKWRPQNFSDVVGQQPVVRTLQNALRQKRVAHAMIFSGVRGVGKTTLARIMAKALNCEAGDVDEPCNQCQSCREITAGTAVDLQEIDGASNRGIQEIRELKENIRFFPTKGRYKVIIIDEVHMLTTEAFNALLKTLEEPPAHVYFMFATTELHKIPVTILSRCQRYELKRVSFAELAEFFAKIAQQEAIEVSRQAIDMIAREAEGSVRDGLSLLDQIFSFGGDKISDDDVSQVLGLVDRQVFESLAKALLAGDLAQGLDLFDKSYSFGIDLKRFANDLLGYFRALLLCKISQQPEEMLDVADQELAILKELAASYSTETLYQYYNQLLKGIEEMQYSSRPRMVLEMAFVRATQSGEVASVAAILARLDGLLQGVDIEREVPANPAAAAAEKPELPPLAASASKPAVQPAASKKTETSKAPPVEKSPPDNLQPEQAGPEIKPRQRDVRKHWEDFVDYVRDRKQWMAHVLRLCSSVKEKGKDLILRFDDRSDCKVLKERENLKALTEFAQDFYQKEFKLQIKVRGNVAGNGNGDEQESPQEERRALANDPLVQMTTEIFGGQVVGIRTGPRSR